MLLTASAAKQISLAHGGISRRLIPQIHPFARDYPSSHTRTLSTSLSFHKGDPSKSYLTWLIAGTLGCALLLEQLYRKERDRRKDKAIKEFMRNASSPDFQPNNVAQCLDTIVNLTKIFGVEPYVLIKNIFRGLSSRTLHDSAFIPHSCEFCFKIKRTLQSYPELNDEAFEPISSHFTNSYLQRMRDLVAELHDKERSMVVTELPRQDAAVIYVSA